METPSAVQSGLSLPLFLSLIKREGERGRGCKREKQREGERWGQGGGLEPDGGLVVEDLVDGGGARDGLGALREVERRGRLVAVARRRRHLWFGV